MRVLLLLIFLSIVTVSHAQKQMVFILHGKVIARYTEGDFFQCILKNKEYRGGTIEHLTDFSIITGYDTIPFLSIAKLEGLPKSHFLKRTGTLLVIAGLGYVAVDQVNAAFGYTKSGFDQSDWNALIIAGVGAGMLMIKPKYTRIKPGTSVRTIDYHSPFYLYDK